MLIVALLGSAFLGSSAEAKMSKAQKAAISKKLMRAVKHNPRVISKRWFLKKASIVSFTLPTTIRLLPASDQQGHHKANAQTTLTPGGCNACSQLNVGDTSGFQPGQNVFVGVGSGLNESQLIKSVGATTINLVQGLVNNHPAGDTVSTLPGGANTASLDLGPSLGSRTIGLGGKIRAQINFNDAFDSGQVGEVKLSIPSAGSDLRSTSVPLLENPNTDDAANHKTGEAELGGFILGPAASRAGLLMTLSLDGTPADQSATVPVDVSNSTLQSTLTTAIAAMPNPLPGGTGTIGAQSIYVYVAPYVSPLVAGCTLLTDGCSLGTVTFVGPRFLGENIPSFAKGTNDTVGVVYVHDPFDAVDGRQPQLDPDGSGGCGDFHGNGLPAAGLGTDADVLSNLQTSLDPGYTESAGAQGVSDPNNLGPGPYGAQGTGTDAAGIGDTVLRIGPLSLQVASGTATVPGDDTGGSTGVKTYPIGPSGGRANLFGASVNGLSNGNSVDVTVNLSTDINTISRQVDGTFPEEIGGSNAATVSTVVGSSYTGGTSLIVASTTGLAAGQAIKVSGSVSGSPTDIGIVASTTGANLVTLVAALPHNHFVGDSVSNTNELNGNINAASYCRQAWSGKVTNYLTGIHLTGSLKIAPAITADGYLRIAHTHLTTPTGKAAKIAVAACLAPYQLYMKGNGASADTFSGFSTSAPIGPNLLGGAIYNPLVVLFGSSTGNSGSAAPTADCNSSSPVLNRPPFSVLPVPGGTGSGLQKLLSSGAAVGVSGDLSVTNLNAEVLVGNV